MNITSTKKTGKKYLTRQDIADMFGVCLNTVDNWSRKGYLQPLGIGKRVYFLADTIHECLHKL